MMGHASFPVPPPPLHKNNSLTGAALDETLARSAGSYLRNVLEMWSKVQLFFSFFFSKFKQSPCRLKQPPLFKSKSEGRGGAARRERLESI